MKPIIGIITRPDYLKSGRNVDIIYSVIRSIIVSLGGIPFALTPPNSTIYQAEQEKEMRWNDFETLLQLCNGFVFQGGDHFYEYDLKVVNYAYEHDIPSLGICLGMQLMAYSQGGKVQKRNHSSIRHYSKNPYAHTILLDQNSLLASILGQTRFIVNSRHHDCVSSTNLTVVGISEDHVIEAIEDKTKKFFIGIQWHPEDMIAYDKITKKLWEFFLLKCKECLDENNRIN